MITGIYVIKSPDGKVYVGQAKDIERRWFNYRTKNRTNRSHPRLYPSFDTLGIENHKFEVIEECSIDQLNIRERYWQEFYDVLGENGMNCKLTTTPEKKGVLREENRIAMSEKLKARVLSEKSIENIRAAAKKNIVKAQTPESIHKSAETRKANYKPYLVSDETRIKLSKSARGKRKPPRSEQHLKNLAIAQQKRYANSGPSYQSKTVLNIETGIYYDSAKEAAKAEGIARHSLTRMLIGKSKKRTCSLIYA